MGRINENDQINTLFRRPGIWNRPTQFHLQPPTYRRYCQIWQRLVCFAYRDGPTDRLISLRHQLNTAQFAAPDQMEIYNQQLVGLPIQRQGLEPSQRAKQQKQAEELLDQTCLAFSVALLDHTLTPADSFKVARSPIRLVKLLSLLPG